MAQAFPASIEQLPVFDLLDSIRDALRQHDSLVIEAPPGAGKTTVIPLVLRGESWLQARKIVMLQPRRLAARNAASRMAELLGESVAETVGYRMRLDTQVGPATQIEVVTEGVLLRLLRDDPALSSVGLLIFDEFHERSLDADLGLALALASRRTFGDDANFKIVVMSATLSQLDFSGLLEGPVITSEGRQYPVQVNYSQAAKAGDRIVDRVVRLTDDVVRRHAQSSVLVFLPGQGEIRRVAEQLQVPDSVIVCPLYGDLSPREQQQAIQPPADGERKLVLATNIAETSLTIEGVDVVIDSGLERIPIYDPNTGMSRLSTVSIAQASAEQRKGRAGRLRPGHCYRLWSEAQQAQLAAQQRPEIDSADLTSLVLQMFAWGIDDPGDLQWITPPREGAYSQAVDLLTGLGALERVAQTLRLTPHGDAMASIAAHPRIAHLLFIGRASSLGDTAALLAAVLTERDPVSRESADMQTRLDYLMGMKDCPRQFRGWEQRVHQLARGFTKQLAGQALPPGTSGGAAVVHDAAAGYLIACAYPDRVARRRHSGSYQLANGRSCQFDESSQLSKHKWLAVAEVSGFAGKRSDVIRSAAVLDPALFEGPLSGLITESSFVDWDSQSGRFVAEHRRHCGALVLSSRKIDQVSDNARVTRLLQLVHEASLTNLHWTKEARDFQGRATLMHTLEPDWPLFTDTELLAGLEDWLAPYLITVKKLGDLKKLDLLEALKSRLDWQQQQQLDAWLPLRVEVPSGSRLSIDYTQSPPVLAVKLQEMFGCEATPSIAQGRIPLMVHLLSPAGRPLQVTQDLGSFWRNAYDAVKKEMRGRYPKHPWPDDPVNATATAHSKRRRG